MWKIPMTGAASERRRTDNRCDCSDLQSLPAFYMDDYSVIGLVVDRLDAAIAVLGSKGYAVETTGSDCPAAITVRESGEIRGLVCLLRENGIGCEIGDTVGEVYRG